MVDEDVEEGVHEQDPLGLNGRGVEQDRLGGPAERVGVQDGLNHDERLGQVLHQQAVPGDQRQEVFVSALHPGNI